MARKPTAALDSALTGVVAQPGYLIRMVLPSQTFRICTFGTGFTYGGYSWAAADAEVSGLSWDQGGVQGGKLVLGDADLVWWTFVLNLQMQDAPIDVWQAYATAPNEAEPLWAGRIGRVVKGPALVSCELVTDVSRMNSPRRRVQNVVPARFLLPSGRVIYIGNDTWTLERKRNG